MRKSEKHARNRDRRALPKVHVLEKWYSQKRKLWKMREKRSNVNPVLRNLHNAAESTHVESRMRKWKAGSQVELTPLLLSREIHWTRFIQRIHSSEIVASSRKGNLVDAPNAA